jgi:hypothetical protein
MMMRISENVSVFEKCLSSLDWRQLAMRVSHLGLHSPFYSNEFETTVLSRGVRSGYQVLVLCSQM